jgi:hypothetical protein
MRFAFDSRLRRSPFFSPASGDTKHADSDPRHAARPSHEVRPNDIGAGLFPKDDRSMAPDGSDRRRDRKIAIRTRASGARCQKGAYHPEAREIGSGITIALHNFHEADQRHARENEADRAGSTDSKAWPQR